MSSHVDSGGGHSSDSLIGEVFGRIPGPEQLAKAATDIAHDTVQPVVGFVTGTKLVVDGAEMLPDPVEEIKKAFGGSGKSSGGEAAHGGGHGGGHDSGHGGH